MTNIDIGTRLAAIERRLATAQRSSRLAHASLEDTALEVFDESGSLRAVIGQQPDGTSGVVAVNGPPPPQPAKPALAPVLSGVAVTWDGAFLDAQVPPLDFSRIEIHTGSTDGFLITETTLRGTLESPRGGTLIIPAGEPVFVRLMARNSSGTAGDPSPQAGPTGPAAVVAQDVLDGIIDETKLAEDAVGRMHIQVGAVGHTELGVGTGNLVPDPSFEGQLTAQLLLANAAWSTTSGNRSPRAVRGIAAPTTQPLNLTELPVSPGDRFFLAADIRASSDWVGDSARFYMRWLDAAGAVLSYGILKATPTAGGPWTRYSAQVQAPAGAVRAIVALSIYLGTGGTVDYDNVEARTVVAAGMVLAESIGTPELAAGAVTATKVAAKTLTAKEVKALSLTGDEIATNTLVARHIAAGQLNATHLAIGVDGNLVADPSFEGPITVGRVKTDWTVVAPGRDSAKALRVDCTATASANYNLQLGSFPATAGQKVWLSVDVQTSADWNGSKVGMYVRWDDATGALLGYSSVNATPTPGSPWQTISGLAPLAAPPQAAVGLIKLLADASSVGTVTFDNAHCRIVIGSRPTGARAEISPVGLRLYDNEGGERVSLVTGQPNFLTLAGSDGAAVATIDDRGNGAFGDLAVAGAFSVGGVRLDSRLAEAPRGVVAIGRYTGGVQGGAGTYGFMELAFNSDPTRMYRIVFDAHVNPNAGGGEAVVTLRDGGASTPSINSPSLQETVLPLGGGWQRVHLETVRPGRDLGAGLHRLLTTFRVQFGPAGQVLTMFGGAGFPAHMLVEDIGPYVPDTGILNAGGGTATPPKQQYTKTYTASWSGSYANRAGYNSYYNSQCVQGYYSSTNGTQAALIGFPSSLASDLAGASIQSVELYLYYAHWYYNSGGKAVIKAHSHASRPGTFSCDSDSQTIEWGKNVGKWIDITSIFDSTSWRGVALDPNNTSLDYYGRAEGVGEGHPPQLKVTYVK
ncbi:hypothetical protein [Streptomyces sp. A1547]|uniref:hypothetical protein n=1 Tax=Streptomyces sp. A1547 TaxID=2563105 RepID=UPI00109E944F|nr:hypothetical protein [Streptomyces sp. A1547]THA38116.1 hypothetical protein E6W17_16650 [Streptomyces sp. A1547]